MSAQEYATIRIERFIDPSGVPTCCADHEAGQTCRFLGQRHFGAVDVCMLGEPRDLPSRGTDYQRPDARCEVWSEQVAERSAIDDDNIALAEAEIGRLRTFYATVRRVMRDADRDLAEIDDALRECERGR